MKKLFLFFIVASFIACTPKTTEKVVVEEEIIKDEKDVDPDCRQFDDLGGRKQEALEAFVLYRDFLKSEDYETAYDYWKTAFRLAPGSDGEKTYHYDDGVKIFTHYYQLAETEDKKKMWADSVTWIYERRAKCFGEDDYLAGRQAFDLYYNFKDHVDNDYIFNLFKQAVDGQGEKASYFVVNPFVKMVVDKIGDKSLTIEEGSEIASQMWNVIDYGTKNCGDNCAAWEIIISYAPDRLESLEAYDGFYDCNYYKERYYPIYLQDPENCDVIISVRAKLLRGDCDPADPIMAELNTVFEEKCKKNEPVEGGLLAEAKALYLAGKYKEAVAKYDEYLAGSEDVEKNASVNFFVSKIYYRDLKDFPKSRKYALDAAKLKSNWGEPYILIGKLYASSGPLCGPGTGWDSQVVTWPAIDKWQYAKNIDPSVSSEANKLIATYEKYMPSVEDIFSRPNINEGDSFYVGCWIQENTTVRKAK